MQKKQQKEASRHAAPDAPKRVPTCAAAERLGPIVLFVAIVTLLAICHRSAAQSGQSQEPISATEEFVKTQVSKGKEADLSAMPDNQVRTTFLETLLFDTTLPRNVETTGVHILGAKVIGVLNLANLEVIHELSLKRCQFTDAVIFSNTSFKKSLDLSQCTFDRQADFNMMTADGRADFNDATFKGRVSFQHASFANDLSADRATFANSTETVWFNNIRVAYNLLINNGSFNAGANFSDADISKGLHMSATQFSNLSSTADFNNLKVGGDVQLENAVFAGKSNFTSIDIAGSLIVSGCRFSNKNAKAVFEHAKIGSDFKARGTQFEGQTSFNYAQISGGLDITGAKFIQDGKSSAEFKNITVGSDIKAEGAIFAGGASFDYAKVTGGLDMSNAEFNGTTPVRFMGVNISGITTLTGVKMPAGISLENATFDVLEIERLSPSPSKWEKNSIILIGLTFREIIADEDPSASSDKLKELAGLAKYDPRTYEKLEAYFTEQGQPEKADDIFIEGKRRERQEVLLEKQNYPAWSGSLLLDWLVGYGRIPGFALIWSAFFVALGCVVFRKDEMEPQQSEAGSHRYSALLYSLDVFAPIIDLKAKSRWVPKSHKRATWIYFVIHSIAGWLLVPIGLAAVTGILK